MASAAVRPICTPGAAPTAVANAMYYSFGTLVTGAANIANRDGFTVDRCILPTNSLMLFTVYNHDRDSAMADKTSPFPITVKDTSFVSGDNAYRGVGIWAASDTTPTAVFETLGPMQVLITGNTFRDRNGFTIEGKVPRKSTITVRGNTFEVGSAHHLVWTAASGVVSASGGTSDGFIFVGICFSLLGEGSLISVASNSITQTLTSGAIKANWRVATILVGPGLASAVVGTMEPFARLDISDNVVSVEAFATSLAPVPVMLSDLRISSGASVSIANNRFRSVLSGLPMIAAERTVFVESGSRKVAASFSVTGNAFVAPVGVAMEQRAILFEQGANTALSAPAPPFSDGGGLLIAQNTFYGFIDPVYVRFPTYRWATAAFVPSVPYAITVNNNLFSGLGNETATGVGVLRSPVTVFDAAAGIVSGASTLRFSSNRIVDVAPAGVVAGGASRSFLYLSGQCNLGSSSLLVTGNAGDRSTVGYHVLGRVGGIMENRASVAMCNNTVEGTMVAEASITSFRKYGLGGSLSSQLPTAFCYRCACAELPTSDYNPDDPTTGWCPSRPACCGFSTDNVAHSICPTDVRSFEFLPFPQVGTEYVFQ